MIRRRSWTEPHGWHFENHLLLLQEVTGDEQPETMVLELCPFWIRLYNLPLDSRSDEAVRIIANKVGTVMEIEEDNLGWDKSRRARVMLNVTKPLRRTQKIRDKRGQIHVVDMSYERLPFFSFSCGVLGHVDKDCLEETGVESGGGRKIGGEKVDDAKDRTYIGAKLGIATKGDAVDEGTPEASSTDHLGH